MLDEVWSPSNFSSKNFLWDWRHFYVGFNAFAYSCWMKMFDVFAQMTCYATFRTFPRDFSPNIASNNDFEMLDWMLDSFAPALSIESSGKKWWSTQLDQNFCFRKKGKISRGKESSKKNILDYQLDTNGAEEKNDHEWILKINGMPYFNFKNHIFENGFYGTPY